jgi:hypothetical protein
MGQGEGVQPEGAIHKRHNNVSGSGACQTLLVHKRLEVKALHHQYITKQEISRRYQQSSRHTHRSAPPGFGQPSWEHETFQSQMKLLVRGRDKITENVPGVSKEMFEKGKCLKVSWQSFIIQPFVIPLICSFLPRIYSRLADSELS